MSLPLVSGEVELYMWIKRTKVILYFAGTVEFASDSSQEQLFCFTTVINITALSLKITIYCLYLHLKQIIVI